MALEFSSFLCKAKLWTEDYYYTKFAVLGTSFRSGLGLRVFVIQVQCCGQKMSPTHRHDVPLEGNLSESD